MSGFCSNCGFPLSASSAFCPKCGTRLSSSGPITGPVAPLASSAPVAARKSSGVKIVLIVCGVLVTLAIIAIGGAAYTAYRIKQAVVTTAKEHGVDLNRIAGDLQSGAASSSRPAHLRKPCDYLSKDDVSRLIGQPIARMVADEEACEYFGPPGLAAKLGKQGMSTGMKQVQGDKVPNAQLAQGLNNLINGMGAQNGEERPLIMFAIDPDGKSQMAALDVAGSLFGQIPGAKPEEISGLGDRAVRFANLGLSVMKGRLIIRIVAGPIPDPDAKTVAVAKALLPLV